MSRRVVFLDRDGTLNLDHGFVHRVDDWEFTDRAPVPGFGRILTS
jgi:D-glycero-D-manno-heptose 1,7-bisphosphate phosphatase